MVNFIEGFIPSPKDTRDFITTAVIPCDLGLESRFSWQDKDPVCINQGNFGTCTGCATAGIKDVHEFVEGDYVDGGFSPLFIYSICKTLDGMPNQVGSTPRTAMQVLLGYGVLPEKDMPYSTLTDINNLPKINLDMINKASKYKIKSYARVPDGDLISLKQALKVSPVLLGVYVYDSFIKCEYGGFIPSVSGYLRGGHAIKCIGWDDELTHTYADGKTKKGFLILKNSWGTTWGNKGLCYVAYEDYFWKSDLGMPFVVEAWSCVDLVTTIVPKYYKVQVGAYAIKDNANNMVQKLKAKGFSTYLPPVSPDGLYRVQVGAFIYKTGAVTLLSRLKEAGFNGYIVNPQ